MLYGLPRRPTDIADISSWAELLRSAKHRVCALTPLHKHFSQENSSNWAGYVGTGGSYNWAYAKWTVPCLASSVKGSDSAAWVGLGGDSNDGGGYLVQAGTDQQFSSDGVYSYYTWIEDYPFNDAQGIDYSLACGDVMSVYVSSNYDYANEPYYSVYDTTSGFYYAEPQAWPISNGSTADWIVERPGKYLADFRSVSYTNCEAGRYRNSNPIYLGNLPHNSVVMWSSVVNGVPSGNELAYPGSISSSENFAVYWDHSS